MESKLLAGAIAYAAYAAAVGGTTHDGRALPAYEELGDRQRDGWEAAARTCGMRFSIGDRVADCTPGSNVLGVVSTVQRNRDGRNGYWLNCIDGTGRPFDHFVREEDADSPV